MLKIEDEENILFQNFGNNYISDAMRVLSTRIFLPEDEDMVYEALCIIMALYIQKIKEGKINERILH